MSSYENAPVPTIVRGEGAYIYDEHGQALPRRPRRPVRRPGRPRPRASWPRPPPSRPQELAFFPLWSYAHPKAVELAQRLAAYAPGDLNKVFFTTGGGEAVETAWKLAKQYFKLTGKPTSTRSSRRAVAYHGTPQGALSITGLPALKAAVRAAGPRRAQGAEHQHLPRAGSTATTRRPSAAGPPTRSSRRSCSRARHGRRGLPRAGAERRRLLPAAARVLPAGARDLRPVRRAAGLRRGHLRLRPARHDVRAATSSATCPT